MSSTSKSTTVFLTGRWSSGAYTAIVAAILRVCCSSDRAGEGLGAIYAQSQSIDPSDCETRVFEQSKGVMVTSVPGDIIWRGMQGLAILTAVSRLVRAWGTCLDCIGSG